MTTAARIANILRKGDRKLWLDPEDALEMAQDLVPVIDAMKREQADQITEAVRAMLNGWVEGDDVPHLLPEAVLATIKHATSQPTER